MHPVVPHLEDFLLVEKCLARNEAAITALQQAHGKSILAYLMRSGADDLDAKEVLSDLWADCLIGTLETPPALSRYEGLCTLRTWLNTVALNRLVTKMRRDQNRDRVEGGSLAARHTGAMEEEEGEPSSIAQETPENADVDAPLLDLMRRAIEHALRSCPADQLVMLQLVHGSKLRLREVAPMFGCVESTVARTIELASAQIERDTLEFLRREDPWLEVRWSDFLELCRTAGFLSGW